MAGPTVSVILNSKMTSRQREAVWALVASFAGDVLPAENSFSSNGRPFVIGWGTDHAELYAESDYASAIGWQPQDALELGAMCNKMDDHRELARLAIRLAREYDGLICFGDSLGEEARAVPGRLWHIHNTEDDLSLPDWAQQTRGIHVGDAEFLENWARHPRFRLVK